MTISTLSEHDVRKTKVQEMIEEHISPWPEACIPTSTALKLKEKGVCQEEEKESHSLAGRLMLKREHGKSIFFELQDATGTIQLYVKKDSVGEEVWNHIVAHIDLGDIVFVEGGLFLTRTGELTVNVSRFTLLSKSLRPLPDKYHGLVDVEQRYRQRYLDLMTNAESREKFVLRSHVIYHMRNFLVEKGYLEVETPMLHPIPGGALAKPFVTHHNAYDIELYLRIAPELYLKKLIIGGFDKVFEINRNFRNEGVSTKHNPEFTTLEFYTAHATYCEGMDLTEALIHHVILASKIAPLVQFKGVEINFQASFKRLQMREAIIEVANVRPDQIAPENIDVFCAHEGIEVAIGASHGQKLYRIFEEKVEPFLVQPTFVTHLPIEVSPLAREDKIHPGFAARFELFIGGMECANGYNELNQPDEQARRFHLQAHERSGGNDEAHYYDASYIQALEHGLPPTAGVGLGIDRIIMLFSGTESIKDVILFPTMRPHFSQE